MGSNTKGLFALVISVCALIISLLAACPSLPRALSNKELQFDYIGAMIGILSLLVVFTVGWQLYNALEVHAKIKEMERLYDDTKEKLIAEFSNNANDLSILAACKQSGNLSEYLLQSIKIFIKNTNISPVIKEIIKSHLINAIDEVGTNEVFIADASSHLDKDDICELRIASKELISPDSEKVKTLVDKLLNASPTTNYNIIN